MLPTLTVAENLFITSFPTHGGLIDRAAMTAAQQPGAWRGWAVTLRRIHVCSI